LHISNALLAKILSAGRFDSAVGDWRASASTRNFIVNFRDIRQYFNYLSFLLQHCPSV